jgi:hypothetical protein
MTRKHVVYNTIGASLLLTGAIVWLSGVDLGELAVAQSYALADAIKAAARHPVTLPVWAIALLCLPTVWLSRITARAITDGFRNLVEWRHALQLRPRWGRKAADAVPVVPQDAGDAPAGAAEADELRRLPLPVSDDYFEDAIFGVIWRWTGAPEADELSPHCAACDDILVPWASGGSLSRGLHCERCNKLRAAGEHPDEIFGKVADILAERKRTGEWRSAPRRVAAASSAATRPLATMPAA